MTFPRDRSIALAVAVLGVAVFASPAPAKMRGGLGGPGPAGMGRGRPSRPGGPGPAGMGRGHPSRPDGRGGFFGFGFGLHSRAFYPGRGYLPYLPYYDYPDYDYDYGPPPEAPRESQAQAPIPAPVAVEPLVIEYQGDQWVRVANYAESPAHAPVPASNPASATPELAVAAEAARELPPAVLVFRDGHREELRGYTIIGAIIYASANYWSTGSWTKTVPIAKLDVPATLKLNQERGGKFSLPSGPNEVVMRP